MKLDFMIKRLLRMSPGEILYRVGQKLQSGMEKATLDRIRFDPTVLAEPVKLFSGPLQLQDTDRLLKLADRLCEGRMDLFALKDFKIEGTINYHKDYKSGKSAPAEVFGKDIDYRDSGRIGDIKYIWELNRHLELVPLALAWNRTREGKYLDAFTVRLEEWLRQNPFLLGVNWASTLELGIRLINWTISWHLLAEDLRPDLRESWLESVHRHCWFIRRNLSAYSSANNHLIGEVAGLFIASVAMPRFRESQKWADQAARVLVREIGKQNHADGVNKEQALSYQQFVLDFFLLSGLAGKANGRGFPAEYWSRIEKMLEYLAALEDVGGHFPHIGDEDDGYVVDLLQKGEGAYRSLLHTGAFLFGRSEFWKGEGGLDVKSQVLLHIANIRREETAFHHKPLPTRFEQGGYTLLGMEWNTPREQKLLFDSGSLGYLSLAAHGHADALSFSLSAGGVPVFVDPGTYAYHADRKWRNYFRSTAAHNTVRVDGKDQSQMAGNFMWRSRAEAQTLETEGLLMVKGMHTGYGRLEDPVQHEREIRLLPGEGIWQLTDELKCKGSHLAEVFFHLHPDCRVAVEGNEVNIHFPKGVCMLKKPEELELQVYRGEEAQPLGWFSPSYDVRVPAVTLRFFRKIEGPVKICFHFKIVFDS